MLQSIHDTDLLRGSSIPLSIENTNAFDTESRRDDGGRDGRVPARIRHDDGDDGDDY